jgi:hypothetical protein
LTGTTRCQSTGEVIATIVPVRARFLDTDPGSREDAHSAPQNVEIS